MTALSLFFCLFSSPAQAQLTSGLISYWDLATDATDSHGSNDGTLQGDAAFGTTDSEPCVVLDGTGDYVDCGSDASFNTGDTLTVCGWVNLPVADTGYIAGKMVDTFNDGWLLGHVSPTTLRVYQNASTSTFTSTGIAAGDWYFCAATIDGAGNNILYVNGSSIDTDSKDENLDSTANFRIGAKPTGSFPQFTAGSIAAVGVWNRALSGSEITELWNGGTILRYDDFAPSGGSAIPAISQYYRRMRSQ